MQPSRDPSGSPVAVLSVSEAAARQADGSSALLVDVRERNELVALRPIGAFLLPMSELPARVDELPADRPLMFICRSGVRSGRVAEALARQGYEDVANVTGGMLAWHAAGLPERSGPIDPDEETVPAPT
jgi:rhodanese-related sulfurtransferase